MGYPRARPPSPPGPRRVERTFHQNRLGEDDRQGELLAEDGRREGASGNVAQDPLAKLDAVKVVTVRGERRFTEGAPVDVVEELSGSLRRASSR